MPTFILLVADKTTGKEQTITLNAKDTAEAEAIAYSKNYAVSRIHVDNLNSPNLINSPRPNSTEAKPPGVPDYNGLLVAGVLSYGVAVILTALGLLVWPKETIAAFAAFAAALSSFIAGSVIYAFRDIAQNSWRCANALSKNH